MNSMERISLEEAKSITEKYLKGNPHAYQSDCAYIKPQSPIHGTSDSYNAAQVYNLISREDLIRNYRYSFNDGRFYYAYTPEEVKDIKAKTPDALQSQSLPGEQPEKEYDQLKKRCEAYRQQVYKLSEELARLKGEPVEFDGKLVQQFSHPEAGIGNPEVRSPKPEKSLQECKDEVARKYGFENWRYFYSDCLKSNYVLIDTYTDEAAELYASQFKQPSQPEGKTLEEVKDAYAKSKGYKNWISFYSIRPITNEHIDGILREYANQLRKEWISVEEHLPKDSGRYWCYVEDVNCLSRSYFQWNCAFCDTTKAWTDRTKSMVVTHWIPLPTPPQK